MTAAVSGSSFTGTIDYGGGWVETYNGIISNDYLSVSGTWSDGTGGGPFKIYALGVDLFQGYTSNGTIEFEFCGAKGATPFPDPCYKK